MALSAGTRLGPYEVLAPIGAGGMGEVYRARDHRLGREVAIKTLPDAVVSDPERRARFEREARALAALAHPTIATLHEIGESEGRPFLVMELVEGQTLSERLADGPMPMAGAFAIAAQLADGLAAAHARGIVHRDLKPSNLALTPDGRLKILDFGLAKTGAGAAATGDDLSRSPTAALGLTHSGVLLGTAGYMCPEQVRGEVVDGRADVWAFGCIVFELLTGSRAFAGSTPWEVLAAVMGDTPDWSLLPRELPPAVAAMLRRCLEKDADKRLPDLGGARAVLGGPASASTWVSVERPRRRWFGRWGSRTPTQRVRARSLGGQRGWGHGKGRAATLVLAALVLAGIGGGLAWWRHRSTAGARPSLAILPFRNLGGGGPDAQWLGDGLAAAVSAQLAEVRGVRIFPAWSTLEAVERGTDPMRAAKLVGADLTLLGTVQSAGGEVRVTFTMLETRGGSQVAGGTVTAPAGSFFAAQDELADEVLAALDLTRPRRAVEDFGLSRPDQQDRYLKALGLLQRYDQAKAIDGAVELLEALAREAPASPLVHAALGRAFLDRFALTHDPSWAPLARSYCERARQLAPHLPEVELTLAQLAVRSGQPTQALALLRHALAVQPGNSEAMLALAQAWDAAGDPARAEEAYRRLIALQPGYWAAYSKLGGFFFSHGRFREAAGMFQRVTELNPDSARAFNNLCGALTAAGELERALAASRRSVALEPTGSGVANLGTLQFYLGRFDEAARSFEEATRLMPSSFIVWFNLGDAYRWSSGRAAEAVTAYRKAIAIGRQQLAIDPNDGVLRASLAMALAKAGDVAEAQRELALSHADAGGPEQLYAAAIVALLAGHDEQATELLRRATAAGYDRRLLAHDPELSRLRGKPGFTVLVAPVRPAA